MSIIKTPIGIIDKGIDGRDEYYLLEDNEDDLTPEMARVWLLPQVFAPCAYPGGIFCNLILASQVQYRRNAVICIVLVQYDN